MEGIILKPKKNTMEQTQYNITRRGEWAILLLLLFVPGSIMAAEYYVAANGDDSADGLSPSTPWQTVGKVNSEMEGFSPGDDVYFNQGDTFTDDQLVIKVGGTFSDPMTIGAYGNGAKPIFEGVGIVCTAANVSHVVIEDLAVKNVGERQSVAFNADNLSDITFSRLEIDGTDRNCILLYRIDGYVIEDSSVSNCLNSGIAIIGSPTYPISNGIIRNNVMFNILSNDGICLNKNDSSDDIGPNHLLENNLGYNCAEDAFDITSGENIIIRDNEAYGNYWTSIGIMHDAKNVVVDRFYSYNENDQAIHVGSSKNVVIRNSVFFNAGYHHITTYGSGPGKWPGEDGAVEGFKFFNNTVVYSADSSGSIMDVSEYNYGSVFKNNIITSTEYSEPGRYLRFLQGATPDNADTTFGHNVWWRPDNLTEGDDQLWYDDVAGLQQFADWQARFPDELFLDPQILDPASGDFSLLDASQAIDAGGPLTVTVGAGSGTELTVEDAGYFCDGLGMVDGDQIRIGTNPQVRITDVDYETDVITVDQTVTWNDGDGVSLPYYGSAPDVGAFEFVPPDVTPPETVITEGPEGTIDHNDVTFEWSGSDDRTPVEELEFQFKMDDDSWVAWDLATNHSFTDLAAGEHQFQAKARDAEGNEDESPASRTFTVDLDSLGDDDDSAGDDDISDDDDGQGCDCEANQGHVEKGISTTLLLAVAGALWRGLRFRRRGREMQGNIRASRSER